MRWWWVIQNKTEGVGVSSLFCHVAVTVFVHVLTGVLPESSESSGNFHSFFTGKTINVMAS